MTTPTPRPIILDTSGPHADTGHSRAAHTLAGRIDPDDLPPPDGPCTDVSRAAVMAWYGAREAEAMVRHVRAVAACAWLGSVSLTFGAGASPAVGFVLAALAVVLHTPVRPRPRRSRMHSLRAATAHMAVDIFTTATFAAACVYIVLAPFGRAAPVVVALYPFRYLAEHVREVVGRIATARDPHAVPEWAVHGIAHALHGIGAPARTTASNPDPTPGAE